MGAGREDPSGRDRWRAEAQDQGRVLLHLLRGAALGAASGLLAGLASFVFLEGLDRVTETRADRPWLLYLLPLAGFVVGGAYHRFGGRAAGGNALIIDEIHEPTAWVPHRMAPMVLVGTWITHLFGGSAGREGTAVQMSGSLSDLMARVLRLRPADRRLVLTAALGGGFGAVFGVPLAGAVFAMEVPSVGRVRYDGIVPALTAAVVGDRVVQALGYRHHDRLLPAVDVDPALLGRVALAGVVFGLAGALFAAAVHGVRHLAARTVGWAPLRPVVGGVVVVVLGLAVSRDYLGLSVQLADAALAGEPGDLSVPAWKLVFTAVTLGSGFVGGEVTPLFVIGATLGAALAGPLGVPVPVLAAIGFVAVFAGAANVPLACTVMGVELFGGSLAVPLAVACVVAYVCSAHRGIYGTQRVHVHKGGLTADGRPLSSRRHDP